MANAFLNPVAVPGMWGERIPAPTRTPITSNNTVESQSLAAADANAVTKQPKAIAWVKMAPDILRAMSLAANHAGRSAGEIWAEAAREWLLRKSLEMDFDVLAHQPVRHRDNGVLEEKQHRLWTSIDTMMGDLRQSRPTL